MDEDFSIRVKTLIQNIEVNQESILNILCDYEPIATASDEIERSIDTLKGLAIELSDCENSKKDFWISTFFPLNLPLYSLILFAVAPSYFSKHLYIRTPEVMSSLILKISAVIGLQRLFPAIHFKQCGRSEFLNIFVKRSDVIIFTGQYENALKIQAQCPSSLFIFNGGGVNPAIVFKDADIKESADKIFEMRTFNSGQDCAGTDAILVDDEVCDEFIDRIIHNINGAIVGEYGNIETDIGPIMREEYVLELQKYLQKYEKNIILEGNIDTDRKIVSPYVLKKPIGEHSGGFHEFFGPIFNILSFRHEQEALSLLSSEEVKEYSMYVSYFSREVHLKEVSFAQVLKNKIVNDVEQGNHSYGGYGSKANFVSFNRRTTYRPILISDEINRFIKNLQQ